MAHVHPGRDRPPFRADLASIHVNRGPLLAPAESAPGRIRSGRRSCRLGVFIVARGSGGFLSCGLGAAARNRELLGINAKRLGESTEVDLGAALSGEPTLINLWASWCGPCRSEIPVLNDYAGTPGAIRVVGINVQDDMSAALATLTDAGVHYPSFTAVADIGIALSAPPVLPLSFLVQRDGSVDHITTPIVFENTDQIRSAVGELMK